MVEPASKPMAVDAGISEQYSPRRDVGEYSPRKVAAPAYSPEAEKLCTIRSNNSNAGAASPMTS